MGKSATSSDSQNGDPAPKVVLIAIAILCLALFVVVWENQAHNVQNGMMKEERQVLNATSIQYNITSFVSVENYFPLRATTISTKITKVTDSGPDNIPNTKQSLEKENIIINSYTYTWKYGDKELRPPLKVNDPTNFPSLNSTSMCNTTVVIDWSYNSSLPNIDETNQTTSSRSTFPSVRLSFSTEQGWLPQNSGNMVWLTSLFFLAFAVSGLAFSWYFFGKEHRQKLDLRRAYGDLVELPSALKNAQANEDEEKRLKSNLQRLLSFPSQIGFLKRTVFGLSFLIFRILINSNWKKYNEKIGSYIKIPYRKKGYEAIFSKYKKEQPLDSVRDSLPELKSVVVAIGFLATVGVTFSWNLGAAAPFVYSAILVYFFFNLGSTFYLIEKSKKDLYLIAFVLVAAIVVVSFPSIISMLRSLEPI